MQEILDFGGMPNKQAGVEEEAGQGRWSGGGVGAGLCVMVEEVEAGGDCRGAQ